MKTYFHLVFGILMTTTCFSQSIWIDANYGDHGYTSLPFNFLQTECQDKKILGLSTYDIFVTLNKITPDGRPDTTFGDQGFLYLNTAGYQPAALLGYLHELADQKIAIGLHVENFSANEAGFLVLRLMPNGALDESFAGSGYLFYPYSESGFTAYNCSANEAGELYVIGEIEGHVAIEKLTLEGEVDHTFGDAGIVEIPGYPDSAWTEQGVNLVFQPDGKMITCAYLGGPGFVTARLMPDGGLDKTFGYAGRQYLPQWTASGNICEMILQPDGKLLYRTYYSFNRDEYLYRLTTTGQFDTSFDQDGMFFRDSIFPVTLERGILCLPDGSYWTAYATGDNEERDLFIEHRLPDFSPDTSFEDKGQFQLPYRQDAFIFTHLYLQDNHSVIVSQGMNTPGFSSELLRLNFDETVSITAAEPLLTAVTVSPNPAIDYLDISHLSASTALFDIQLGDSQGKLVQQWPAVLLQNESSTRLTLPDISPGYYVVSLISGNHIAEAHGIIIHP